MLDMKFSCYVFGLLHLMLTRDFLFLMIAIRLKWVLAEIGLSFRAPTRLTNPADKIASPSAVRGPN